MPSPDPELLASTPSDTLRKLRAQLIVGDVTDRLSAVTSLLTALVDKELMHETRGKRDKEAQEAYAKAADAVAKKSDEDTRLDDELPHPASTKAPAGVTARR